ncbi:MULTISPECIES: glycoside hydrolase family 172 protein [unclassified Pedobacter]|uniref:glycoside hydrolase family 172 protein n=1 Tax=unclassified Pedobacter TaxID=2628915 RepID=UPI001E3C692F|nr:MULTISPECIES: glycoside hydrolase family 172 protein [unclassified Pedobacter]
MTANKLLKTILFFCVLLVSLPNLLSAQQNLISVKSELELMTNIGNLPKYTDAVIKQYSSYDTTGNNDDGFSGKYSFIKKNPDSSLVIFEDKGAGVINRIWTPTPTNDIIDFYFDGSKKPSYSIKFSDLFSGNAAPFQLPLCGNQIGGYYCYFPIPYKNGCKVVFRGKKLEFYQIQYRNFGKKANVKTFDSNLNQEETAALAKVSSTWLNVKKSIMAESPIDSLVVDKTISTSQNITLAEIDKGGRLLGFEIENATQFEGLNKKIDIKITWDNESRPAVYMPIADFFGYAFGKISMQSLLIGTANNINYNYFSMPFDNHAKVELYYRNSSIKDKAESLRIKAKFYYAAKVRNQQTEGKFYAYWNSEQTTAGKPHVFLSGAGKGHYVGTILQAQGLTPGMTLFFEGDDYTAIDGKMSMHGTGSEDYFNGGWYALLDRWDRKMSLPIHGSLDYSLPFSRTGGYRLFLTDKMPFNQSILHTIEHGPEQNNKPGVYTSVAFYYGEKAIAKSNEPTEKSTTVFLPDTMMVYPQLMNLSFNGQATIDGNNIISRSGAQVRIDLQEIPKGKYKLYADMETAGDGAEITIWQRQTKVSNPISFYTAQKTYKRNEFLCDIEVNEFRNTITLHFKNDKDKNRINIGRLILIKK